jgi:biopolymer transport protein TolR
MHLNAEINVVSLIDVMMLLLVIFMLTAPMMTTGLDVKLPEADAKPTEASGGMTVVIDKAGVIHLNESAMNLAQFKARFKSIAGRSKSKNVRVMIDEGVTWGVHAPVMAAINAAGIVDISYAMNPAPVTPPVTPP